MLGIGFRRESRPQQRRVPPRGSPLVPQSGVKSGVGALPELDLSRLQFPDPPLFGYEFGVSGEPLRGDVDVVSEGGCFGEGSTLLAGECDGAGTGVAGDEIVPGLVCGALEDAATDPDTPHLLAPVEEHGSCRILPELTALGAVGSAGETPSTPGCEVFQDQHARVGYAIGADGRHCHRVGLLDVGSFSEPEPIQEQLLGSGGVLGRVESGRGPHETGDGAQMITEGLTVGHGPDGMVLHMSKQPRNPVTDRQWGADELRGYLQSRLAGMSPGEAGVLRLAIEDPQFTAGATTAELAERAGVSPPTVVRAARSAGFEGFSGLKLGLAYARGSARFFTPSSTLSVASTPGEVVSTVIDAGQRALRAAEGVVDSFAVGEAAERLGTAGRVVVVGAGTSAAVAADIAFRLTTVGVVALSTADHMSALVAARLLREGDVALAFSATGRTPHTLAVCDAARSSGATLVAITNQAQAPLALLADIALIMGGDDLEDQMAAGASRVAHLAIADAIVNLLALRSPERVHTAERAGTDLP